MIDIELIALIGATAAVVVLAVAPIAAVYAMAFVVLTPVLGVALWLLLKSVNGMRAPVLSPRGQALERGLQSYIASGLAGLIFLIANVVRTRRLGQAPGSEASDGRNAPLKNAALKQGAPQGDPAVPP